MDCWSIYADVAPALSVATFEDAKAALAAANGATPLAIPVEAAPVVEAPGRAG
jgi:hypothetical protein